MKIDDVSNLIIDQYGNNERFRFVSINSNSKTVKNIKDYVKNMEEQCQNEHKNLIILVGDMCSLGITFPYVDIVMLFNDIKSSDKIIQQMFRCMTESTKGNENLVLSLI